MVLDYNKYTNAGYWEHDWNGVYVAAVVNGENLQSGLLKATTEHELDWKVSKGDSEIYLVVSGMSVMPVTVRFEEGEV